MGVSMVRLISRARLSVLTAAVLFGSTVAAVPTVQAAPVPDDTPVLLTPKGEHENGDDENANFDKLRDAYYWSRLLAGDDQLTLEQAAGLRSKASGDANTLTAET